jgi:hypothetical protein
MYFIECDLICITCVNTFATFFLTYSAEKIENFIILPSSKLSGLGFVLYNIVLASEWYGVPSMKTSNSLTDTYNYRN